MEKRCPVCGRPMVDKKKKAMTILGLAGWDEKEVTPEVLKKAYHSLARISHPDMGGDSEVFHVIKEAKNVLEWWVDVEAEIEAVGRETIVKHVQECQASWRPGMICPICRR